MAMAVVPSPRSLPGEDTFCSVRSRGQGALCGGEYRRAQRGERCLPKFWGGCLQVFRLGHTWVSCSTTVLHGDSGDGSAQREGYDDDGARDFWGEENVLRSPLRTGFFVSATVTRCACRLAVYEPLSGRYRSPLPPRITCLLAHLPAYLPTRLLTVVLKTGHQPVFWAFFLETG